MSYPSEFEIDIVLRDGQVAQVRPIKETDGDLLLGFFETLGPESRYFRFFSVKNHLSPDEVQHFVSVDYSKRMAFLVIYEGELVAIGRYDDLPHHPGVGEIAFAVADKEQGRGIGTELVTLLTTYAREQGFTSFRAYVLPENAQMMRVFRNSGFELERTLDSGSYIVNFPVALTDDARAAAEDRERRAVAASILPLFFPRSIALIGASTRPGAIGNTLFKNMLNTGFSGTLYPVNPNTQSVQGVRAYPSVTDIPGDIDLAIVCVPAPLVLEVARQCAEKDVRGLVVVTAGFGEVGGEGGTLEAELIDIARDSGMRVVGPNCMGLLNTSQAVNMNATFAAVYPPAGNIAMSSQSGALGIAILEFARRNSIGMSQFISIGNKADVSTNDLLPFWEQDPATDVILLYLESFGNPRKFARLARRVARKKPIVAVKSGRTASGSRAASSHTGALASPDTAVDALFKQSGVIRVSTLEELFDVGSLLANQPVPKGRRVGIVTNAGGPGIIAADALESNGLMLPEFSAELQAVLQAPLPSEATVSNPVDLVAGATEKEYLATVKPILESGEVDTVLVIYVPISEHGTPAAASVIKEIAAEYDGPATLVTVFMQAEEAVALLNEGQPKVPVYQFPEGAAKAIAKVADYGDWLQRDPGVVPDLDNTNHEAAKEIVAGVLSRDTEGGWLEPSEVEALLGAFGIPLPQASTVKTADEAVLAAERIGGPVVLKIVSDDALHKSDVGGILLNLEGEVAVRAGFDQVSSVVENWDGVLVQEMVAGGHEILIGVDQDPNFGPLIVYGLGGIYVELLEDVAFRLHPLTDVDVDEMVESIKGAPLLHGYRNMPKGDIAGVKDVLLRVSEMVGIIPEISEMDMNPVKVLEPGEGVRVVDARIKVVPVAPQWQPSMIDIPGRIDDPKGT